MRRASAFAVLALLAPLAGCGSDVVVDTTASADAYDGPLDVRVSYDDYADVMTRSGSAGLALECTGAPSNGGGADYDSGLASTQSSAEEAVANWFDEEGNWFGGLPLHGYSVERADADGWTLLSYDVGGATKAAVVVSDEIHDYDDHTGWGVYAWAMCDPAEFPAAMTDELGLQIWEDTDGHRIAQSTVLSFQGAEHCDWQDITFLRLGHGPRAPQFVSDDRGEFGDQLRTTYDGSARLPADAVDTGFRRAGRHLWVAADRSAAYLVALDDDTDVQRWPRAERPIYCD